MKKILLFVALFVSAFSMSAQKTWVGPASGGNWSDPLNWSGGALPNATDEVVINNGGTMVFTRTFTTGVNDTTMGQLKILNATKMTFDIPPAIYATGLANPSVIFRINGLASDPDLLIDGSSSLTLTGTSPTANTYGIIIGLAAGATAEIYGNLTMTSTTIAAGPYYSHSLQVVSGADAIKFKSGSSCTFGPFVRGNPFGGANFTTATGTVLFENGSNFIALSGSTAFGAATATAKFNPSSNYFHKNSSIMSVSGRTFGNLEINNAAYVGSTSGSSIMLVNGNLTITAGTPIFANSGGVDVKGNVTVASGASLTVGTATVSLLFRLNGLVQQNIVADGPLNFVNSSTVFQLSNLAGAKLFNPITVRTFSHSSGKFLIGNNNFVVIDNYSGGSSASYVVTDGSGSFTIPVLASATKIAHVGLSTLSYDPVEFVNDATPKSFSIKVGSTLPYATLNNTNTVARVWDINRIGSGNLAQLSLTPNDLTTVAGGTFTPGSVVLGHGNGTSFDVIPATNNAGKFSSVGAVSAFSPFIVANDVALGVTLTSFSAQLTNKNTVMLNWQTENEKDNSGFEIQRSADAKTWSKIGFVKGKGQSSVAFDYSFEDKGPLSILTYYRLKQVDFDGKESYSKVVNVTLNKKGDKFSVFPNPVSSKSATISLDDDMLDGVLIITNSIGAVVKKEKINSKTFNLDLGNLSNGLYIFEVQKDQNRTFQKVLIF
jgi:Secretion system C-terminal sorting domain